MFATITTISQPENFWGKLRYNLLPPPVQTERIHVEEGSDFLHLRVPIVRGKIYWNNVRTAAGDAGKALLIPSKIEFHEQINLRHFHSSRFMGLVTVNSFISLLKLLPRGKLVPECAVIDYSALHAEELSDLPRYCRTIKIITANPEKYDVLRRRCLNEYGCALNINDNLRTSFSSPVILIPAENPPFPLAFSAQSLVFAPSANGIYTARLLCPEGVSLPAKYLSLMPKGIHPASFAAALYEVSGVHSLRSCKAPCFRQNNFILSYRDVISMLD